MNNGPKAYESEHELFHSRNFDIRDLQDEIRADELCGRLLRTLYLDLTEEDRIPPAEASALAYGADYFLREFVIPNRRENIFHLRSGRVRQFAGNWYIVHNLEPNMTELTGILRGVNAFYRYCRKVGKVSPELARAVQKECADLEYYRQRIETFWAIREDGYFAWEKECTLKE